MTKPEKSKSGKRGEKGHSERLRTAGGRVVVDGWLCLLAEPVALPFRL